MRYMGYNNAYTAGMHKIHDTMSQILSVDNETYEGRKKGHSKPTQLFKSL